MASRVNKSKMACNKPRRSTRPGKKMMVKACEGGKEKIIHFLVFLTLPLFFLHFAIA